MEKLTLRELLTEQKALAGEIELRKSALIEQMLADGVNKTVTKCNVKVKLNELKRANQQTSCEAQMLAFKIEQESNKICEANCTAIRAKQAEVLKLEAEIDEMLNPALPELRMKLANQIRIDGKVNYSVTLK
jgi:hypothetical protein